MKNRRWLRRPAKLLFPSALALLLLTAPAALGQPGAASGQTTPAPGLSQITAPASQSARAPSLLCVLPFIALLLCIALFPLVSATAHWWDSNLHRLFVSLALAAVVLLYYLLRGYGVGGHGHASEPGLAAVGTILRRSVLDEYVPFIILLFSLFTISGGINLRGDLPAHPITNTAFLAIGAALASLIGTTGAAMLLIRPLLQVNSERRHVKHTVIFFIFLVANIGGCLTPLGDPPLFLGYLLGVPFAWTFSLWKEWAFCVVVLLAVYYAWDMIAYRTEAIRDVERDEAVREPLRVSGKINIALLLGVVFAVALLDASKPLPGTNWRPFPYMREIVQLCLAGLSLALTAREVRRANNFNFVAIGEVAALFIGIFITMQAPIEILTIKGAAVGLAKPWHFFWASGGLSSILDNAPTYVVFLAAACALPIPEGAQAVGGLAVGAGGAAGATGQISAALLAAISCGSVFMGANTYIGNGPNFMVKSIAEQSGVKMPSFFGYLLYSGLVLIPLFIIVTLVFFV